MRIFLLTLTLVSFSAWPGFEKLTVEKLDLDYVSPTGKGMVDRVGIGMSFTSRPYPIEIKKTEKSFELFSPYVDFTWFHPLKFIYDMEEVFTRKMTAAVGTKRHIVESEYAMVKTKTHQVYQAHFLKAYCEGGANGDFDKRFLEDCVRKMEMTIRRLDIPADVIFNRMIKELPFPPENQVDIPADNFSLQVTNGHFSLVMFLDYWFYSGLRMKGFMQFEDEYNILALRIDEIKFGYFPVTSLVMKKLQEMVKTPDVTIDPPWIRIKTLRLYENQ
jgi:hypothetical protein